MERPDLRILALVTEAFGANGGIARYNADLVTALAQSGCVSHVDVLPRFGQAVNSLPEKVWQARPIGSRVLWSAKAFSLARRTRYDAIFCGHLNAVPLAALIERSTRTPLWLQAHGIEAWRPRSALYRRSIKRSKLITAVSRHTRRKFLAWADVAPSRVRVLPNTVSSHYRPAAKSASLCESLGLFGKKVILTIGRLSDAERYKGHDRIIAALPRVLESVPEAAYLIVGSGADRRRLEDLARDLGIAERLVFAEGVSNERLPDYVALADVFAMPSTGEGFGIVFLEAAACGIPVIGGNLDGSVDALADGKIGRLVDPTSQTDIVAALVNALQGRQTPGVAAARRFHFDHFARHVDGLVRTLVT